MIKQKGMLYDVTLCIGCGACYNACKEQNKLPATNKDYLKDHLSDKTYTVLEQYGELYSRKNCMHCQEPACVSVCPVGAFKKTELGPVVYDVNKTHCRFYHFCFRHNKLSGDISRVINGQLFLKMEVYPTIPIHCYLLHPLVET